MGVYCKLVPLAEHWRLLSAAADDSHWPAWAGWLLEGSSGGLLQAGWLLEGSSGGLLQAGSAGRTLEAVGCS